MITKTGDFPKKNLWNTAMPTWLELECWNCDSILSCLEHPKSERIIKLRDWYGVYSNVAWWDANVWMLSSGGVSTGSLSVRCCYQLGYTVYFLLYWLEVIVWKLVLLSTHFWGGWVFPVGRIFTQPASWLVDSISRKVCVSGCLSVPRIFQEQYHHIRHNRQPLTFEPRHIIYFDIISI